MATRRHSAQVGPRLAAAVAIAWLGAQAWAITSSALLGHGPRAAAWGPFHEVAWVGLDVVRHGQPLGFDAALTRYGLARWHTRADGGPEGLRLLHLNDVASVRAAIAAVEARAPSEARATVTLRAQVDGAPSAQAWALACQATSCVWVGP